MPYICDSVLKENNSQNFFISDILLQLNFTLRVLRVDSNAASRWSPFVGI